MCIIFLIVYGDLMKKDLLIFATNVVALLCAALMIVHFAPLAAEKTDCFNQSVITVFSPYRIFKNLTGFYDTKSEKTDNTITTTSQNEQDSVMGIQGEDGDLYSDITEVPEDIAKLMSDAEKTIQSEEVKGKTSEEEYFGGGTLVTYGNVEVQSKIPTSFYALNIENLLNQKADLSIKDMSKPTILVYHSHTTESYTLLDVGYYTESLDLRSEDNAKNMVRVGDELCEYLRKMGFNVIHDTEIHDKNYTGAYASSRRTVEEYLEEYPTIDITIDVHRDDITYDNKTKVKPTVTVNGKKAARMMIIAGAEYGRVEKYPDWEYNLKFVLDIQNKASQMYKGLMRPVLFSERKYNMDETRTSFLLEIGTDANTLDEACYSARLFAVAFGTLLKEKYVEN